MTSENANLPRSKVAISYHNPWLVMPTLVIVIYSIYLAVQWPLAGEHLFGYVGFNHKRVDSHESVIPPKFVSKQFGYDGQFYYRFSLDPFSNKEKVQGLSVDRPAWRQQRILLPVFTWLIARGDAELSVVVMLAINLLSVAGLTLVGGALLKHHGLSPWPALLLAFYPGLAISVERFLCEPLSLLLLLLSVLSLVKKRFAWGGMFLALAVLGRETALAAALAVAGIWFLQTLSIFKNDQWKAPGPVYWLPAFVVYIAWQAWLQANWSATGLAVGTSGTLLGLPLAGMMASFVKLISQLTVNNMFFLLMMLATVAWALLVAFMLRRSQGPYRWIWLAYLLLASILGVPIWDNSPGFLRITVELNVIGMLIYLVTSNAHRRWVISAWLGCWLLTAGAEGYRLHLIDQARVTHAVEIVGVSPSINSRPLTNQPFVRKTPS